MKKITDLKVATLNTQDTPVDFLVDVAERISDLNAAVRELQDLYVQSGWDQRNKQTEGMTYRVIDERRGRLSVEGIFPNEKELKDQKGIHTRGNDLP